MYGRAYGGGRDGGREVASVGWYVERGKRRLKNGDATCTLDGSGERVSSQAVVVYVACTCV